MRNVDSAIDEVMDLRAELAMGPDDDSQRERSTSKAMPRQHADYIYRGGYWDASQRIHNSDIFQRSGGKTAVYNLLSQNIQEGFEELNIVSSLNLEGNIAGEDYVMSATLSARLNSRNIKKGKGERVGELFPPIVVKLRKPLPETNEDGSPFEISTFTLENNTEFFVNEGRTNRNVKRTGFLPQIMENLGKEIINQIDPDEVLATMIQLVQNAVDKTPENA